MRDVQPPAAAAAAAPRRAQRAADGRAAAAAREAAVDPARSACADRECAAIGLVDRRGAVDRIDTGIRAVNQCRACRGAVDRYRATNRDARREHRADRRARGDAGDEYRAAWLRPARDASVATAARATRDASADVVELAVAGHDDDLARDDDGARRAAIAGAADRECAPEGHDTTAADAETGDRLR